jgi:tetratricopeptide (TPR) repeat protein
MWLFTVVIPLLIVFVWGGYWAYRQWVTPYEIPTIPVGLTLTDIGLGLEKELQFLHMMASTPLQITGLPDQPTIDPSLAQIRYQAGLALLKSKDHASRMRGIAYLQSAVRSEPDNLLFGNALRRAMRQVDLFKEAVQWWESIENHTLATRINLALTYVDAMADQSIGEARVGQLSFLSMGVLDEVLEEQPYNWIARYARGLNNLYWPIGMHRYEKAVSDLSFAIALAEAAGANPTVIAMSWTAYGDALVKSGSVSRGLRAWQDAHRRFPDYRPLAFRAAVRSEQEAIEVVQKERGMEGFHRPEPDVPDLGLLWEQG